MSQVTYTYPMHPPMVSMRGATPWEYRCTWLVRADGRMPGAVVVESGRLSANGIRVPNYGDTLNMTIDGSTIVDNSVYAYDFESRMVGGGDNKQVWDYFVDVTWRAPNSSGGNPGGVRGEHPAAIPFRDQPTQRPPEVWVEFESQAWPKYNGQNIDTLAGRTSKNTPFSRAANTDGCIVNANGEAQEPQHIERTIAVMCAKSYITDFSQAIALNALYEGTVNSDTFFTSPPHFAKYRRAETGYPEYYNGQRYFELIVKVDIGRVQWYHEIPNEGTYYYDPAQAAIVQSNDVEGRALSGRFFPLDLNGQFRTAGPLMLQYLLYAPASYANLVPYFQ